MEQIIPDAFGTTSENEDCDINEYIIMITLTFHLSSDIQIWNFKLTGTCCM